MSIRDISRREWELLGLFQCDSVSVRNLHLVANAGRDIWGRSKPQPVDISIRLSLSEPFASAASSDALDGSTVHYGQLSKAILAAVQTDGPWMRPQAFAQLLLDAARSTALNPKAIDAMEIDAAFCKGSRYGDAAGLIMATDSSGNRCCTMYLRNLRIPTLIGVNSHERAMKQIVVVTVWIDRAGNVISDNCCGIEQIVVKTVEESTFETLESLAEKLASSLAKYMIVEYDSDTDITPPSGVRLRLEKPSAVLMADTPIIEIYRSFASTSSFGVRMRKELSDKRWPRIPFPLQGRLDDFLRPHD